MGLAQLWEVIVDTAKTTGVLSLIVGASFTFSFIVAKEQIPQAVGSFLLDITDNKYMLLLLINIVFLVLGMFIDTIDDHARLHSHGVAIGQSVGNRSDALRRHDRAQHDDRTHDTTLWRPALHRLRHHEGAACR